MYLSPAGWSGKVMSKHWSCFSGAHTYLSTSSLPFPGGGIVGRRGESGTPGRHWIIAGSDSAKNSLLQKNGACGAIIEHVCPTTPERKPVHLWIVFKEVDFARGLWQCSHWIESFKCNVLNQLSCTNQLYFRNTRGYNLAH